MILEFHRCFFGMENEGQTALLGALSTGHACVSPRHREQRYLEPDQAALDPVLGCLGGSSGSISTKEFAESPWHDLDGEPSLPASHTMVQI